PSPTRRRRPAPRCRAGPGLATPAARTAGRPAKARRPATTGLPPATTGLPPAAGRPPRTPSGTPLGTLRTRAWPELAIPGPPPTPLEPAPQRLGRGPQPQRELEPGPPGMGAPGRPGQRPGIRRQDAGTAATAREPPAGNGSARDPRGRIG